MLLREYQRKKPQIQINPTRRTTSISPFIFKHLLYLEAAERKLLQFKEQRFPGKHSIDKPFYCLLQSHGGLGDENYSHCIQSV